MATALSDEDVAAVRAEVAAGTAVTVWFTPAAVGVPAGGSAKIVAVGEVAEGDFIEVRPTGSRDTGFFSPAELTRARPPRKRSEGVAGVGRAAGDGAGPAGGRRGGAAGVGRAAADDGAGVGAGGRRGGASATVGGARSADSSAGDADARGAGAAGGRRPAAVGGEAAPGQAGGRGGPAVADGAGRAAAGTGAAGAAGGRRGGAAAAGPAVAAADGGAAGGRRAAGKAEVAGVDGGDGGGRAETVPAPAEDAVPERATAKRAAAAARTSTASARAAKRPGAARSAEVTVTLRSSAEGEWTVEVETGAKRSVRPTPVQPGDVAAAARSLPPAVATAIDASLESARVRQRERVERLRAELEAAQKALDELAP